jgi:hypothetical protein
MVRRQYLLFAKFSSYKEAESVKNHFSPFYTRHTHNPSEFYGYPITTHLTFLRKWGLGTSSTLINNIAQWLQIDALRCLKQVLEVGL